jgi:hypothetical protein
VGELKYIQGLVHRPEGREPPGNPRRKRDDNIKLGLNKVE